MSEEYTVTEWCPHCESEIEMTWNVEDRGYKSFCPPVETGSCSAMSANTQMMRYPVTMTGRLIVAASIRRERERDEIGS